MKHGKKPTREQKMMLKEAGLVPENWLVVKNMEDHIEVVSKKSLSDATKKPKTRKVMKQQKECGIVIEKIIYIMNLVIMGTVFYTSLTESYLQRLLIDDPDTKEDVLHFFEKRSFMVAGITMILSILPIIGQLYALFLSFITIFLDDREHVKGSYSDNEEDDMSIRELIVQMMKDDFKEE